MDAGGLERRQLPHSSGAAPLFQKTNLFLNCILQADRDALLLHLEGVELRQQQVSFDQGERSLRFIGFLRA